MITVATARELASSLLTAAGLPADKAAESGEAIVLADAWGLSSHGLMRLPYYLDRLTAGGTNAKAELRRVSDKGAAVALDGGSGLGHWQLWRAADLAAERCACHGVAAISVGNSGHCGALGVYVLPLLRAKLAGIVFSNGPAVMPPWGGSSPVVSTSPMAFGFPIGDGRAIVDLASSAVTRGKIAEHARSGQPLPEGWALDAAGRPTTDPTAGLHGMLAPLGGAKGFALAFAVEALTGGIVGPALANDVTDMFAVGCAGESQGIAHLIIALDPDVLSSNGDARQRLSELAAAVAGASGRVPGAQRLDPDQIPGDTPLEIHEEVRMQLETWRRRLG